MLSGHDGGGSSTHGANGGHPSAAGHPLLFGVDLEDIRAMMPDGDRYEDRLRKNAERILEFLRGHRARATFFVVGHVAREHPSLVREILSEGHEIASHSREHVPLERLGPSGFRDDLKGCLEDLARGGAEGVTGFRAPGGSLVYDTRWAYDILREMGFQYSSSVVATWGPFYGWPGFGPDRPQRVQGVWELPVTLSQTPGFRWPLVGGVYFRLAPPSLVRFLVRRRMASGDPFVTYLHAHDIDAGQEPFMHPQIGGNRLLNRLMYHNRAKVFERLDRVLGLGMRIGTYRDYVSEHLDGAAPEEEVTLGPMGG